MIKENQSIIKAKLWLLGVWPLWVTASRDLSVITDNSIHRSLPCPRLSWCLLETFLCKYQANNRACCAVNCINRLAWRDRCRCFGLTSDRVCIDWQTAGGAGGDSCGQSRKLLEKWTPVVEETDFDFLNFWNLKSGFMFTPACPNELRRCCNPLWCNVTVILSYSTAEARGADGRKKRH